VDRAVDDDGGKRHAAEHTRVRSSHQSALGLASNLPQDTQLNALGVPLRETSYRPRGRFSWSISPFCIVRWRRLRSWRRRAKCSRLPVEEAIRSSRHSLAQLPRQSLPTIVHVVLLTLGRGEWAAFFSHCQYALPYSAVC
jgi:hypothetical protein